MRTQGGTRREFIRSGVYLVISGLGVSLLPRDAAAKNIAAPIDPNFEPAYLKLHQNGELKKRAEALWKMMECCRLCPRQCGAARLDGEEGMCSASAELEISACHKHFGEEPPLVGTGGSGTIFLTNCNLRCVYCINWEINHKGVGSVRSTECLARMMLKLQNRGCHNINLVTPTHYAPHILMAIDAAAGQGLRLPIVYNTSGWERLEVLKLLDGVIDIYLPDFKYGTAESASKYSSGADTYPEVTKIAIMEMHRQVGDARPAADGLIYRGLMIRHLVLPNRVSGSQLILQWIAENLPRNTFITIMSQYRPCYKAHDYPAISRRITKEEYEEVLNWARNAGLTNIHAQSFPH